jgi:hypothetical protein
LATLLPRHPSLKDEYARLMQEAERAELENLERLLERRERYGKPVVVARTVSAVMFEETGAVAEKMKRHLLTPYPTAERAARALAQGSGPSDRIQRVSRFDLGAVRDQPLWIG